MTNEDIGSAADFVALGLRKERDGDRAADLLDKQRAYRCALGAFEAATAASPVGNGPAEHRDRIYGKLRALKK